MFNSKKIAAVAGLLGGFAVISVGAVQASPVEGPGRCVNDGKGHIRCVQTTKHRFTTDKLGNVELVNESTQTCSTSENQVTCTSNVVVPDKKS
ncbi:hypothetical protein [Streptomyces sp. HC307]|uniref:hypothetical protein n=1 Tax=Streptomyces flavusporus TaxID=3385496 RepID=UPI003917209F